MSIEITLQAGEKEAPFVYFEQTILDQAKAVDASDKNAVESFKKELIGIRKAKDQQLKTAIKTDLIHLKEKQTALLASFISERDEALAKAADDFAKISNPTKKDKQDYSDIEKGIEISAKRSASKAKSEYVKNIQLIKRKRSELYAEYLRVLAIRGVKESGADRLNERYLEAYGRFNLKASLSNKKFWIEKIEENISRDKRNDVLLNNMGWIPLHFWSKDVEKNLDECIKEILEYVSYQTSEKTIE